jgi:hypothetical protein
LGLAQPQLVDDVIRNVLPKYTSPKADITEESYTQDLRRILAASQTDSQQDRKRLADQAIAAPFVRCRNIAGEIRYCLPNQAYIPSESLFRYFAGNKDAWFVDQENNVLSSPEFLTALESWGVVRTIRRVAQPSDLTNEDKERQREKHPDGATMTKGSRETVKDYTLDGLDAFLQRLPSLSHEEQVQSATALWQLLVDYLSNIKPSEQQAFFQGTYCWTYYTVKCLKFDSKFVRKLREERWLPGLDDVLCAPKEVCFSQLTGNLASFELLQKALHFKPEIILQLARASRIDPALLDYIQRNSITLDQLKQLRSADDSGREDIAGSSGQHKSATDKLPGNNGNSSQLRTVPERSSHNNASNINSDRTTHGDQESETLPRPRMNSYLETHSHNATESNENSAALQQERELIAHIGVEAAMRYERAQGRNPEELPPNHEGWDITSYDMDTETAGVARADRQLSRHIEVKATKYPWDGYGVGLTPAEIKQAIADADNGIPYFLYVVENALDSSKRSLHVVENPSTLVTSYRLDDPWKLVAIDTVPVPGEVED